MEVEVEVELREDGSGTNGQRHVSLVLQRGETTAPYSEAVSPRINALSKGSLKDESTARHSTSDYATNGSSHDDSSREKSNSLKASLKDSASLLSSSSGCKQSRHCMRVSSPSSLAITRRPN